MELIFVAEKLADFSLTASAAYFVFKWSYQQAKYL